MTTQLAPAAPKVALAPQRPVRKKREGRAAVMYLLPAGILLLALMAYPLYQLVQISLYEYNQPQASGAEPLVFIGLDNYIELFGDEQFWSVLVSTVLFAAVCVVGSLLVGTALAILATRVRTLPRMLLFLAALGAWATPAMAGSYIWLFLFDADFGVVNEILGMQGHSWTFDRLSAFGLVAAEVIWCSFPFVMMTMYAGIKNISSEIIEAAQLDGASWRRTATQVILPILRPLIVIATIQSIIWDFKIFTQIYVMTNGGGIAGQNLVLNVYTYQKAFAGEEYGLGAAIGVVMTVLLMLITVLYLRTQRRTGWQP
ncbi:sugar ABC transporter permease [Kibdelosporangium philippinense]|uniref:Sugar ABC transporter permease n=1 Tax=Kibdelosporangium philippinense TaxID=211113 RepID=A0ABS8Z3A6_9PSEU|nr:sugar ABC transporter permease [Kibdelosporangium philippinense]MCE7001837.1 sugar ABC transporter permease [Kibdelosporangium philippinense]